MQAALSLPPQSLDVPLRLNRWIAVGLLLFNGLLLSGLPFLLAHSLAWALLPLAFFWVFSAHWALVHEGIHKMLDPDPSQNEWLSRMLSILMGASFHVLRFGHLTHHQLNRQWHPEFVAKKTWLARAGYYYTLLQGLYLSEVAGSYLLALLSKRQFLWLARRTFLKPYPEVARTGERFFFARGNIRAVRQDVLAITLLYGAAFYVYGAGWPLLLGFILLRGAVISFLDNIYHYDTPADNSKPGKELALPHALSALLMHANYHNTHHIHPDVPWRWLPKINAAEDRGFDGGFTAHGWMQFKGPVLLSSL